jgi:hypothetical protein
MVYFALQKYFKLKDKTDKNLEIWKCMKGKNYVLQMQTGNVKLQTISLLLNYSG